MKIINITSNTYAYVIIRDLSLKPGESGSIDADILLLTELKGLRNLAIVREVILSDDDYDYIVAKIASMGGGSGGDSPVRSVNSEIGDVVLTAGKIKVGNGSSIEQQFGKLSSVAYSGNYLDLDNRPSGPGEPFNVIDWNPYKEALVEKEFTPNNSSTLYSNGVITRKPSENLNAQLVEVGYDNSPEIIVTNSGDIMNLNFTPNGNNSYQKTMGINDLKSLAIRPVDQFSHNGNPKGASFSFFIFQLEEGEDITTMSLQDILGKTHIISVGFINMYQLEYNSFTSLNYNINVNNTTIDSQNLPFYGNYDLSNFKIEDGVFSVGNGTYKFNLVDHGFSLTKKYAGLFIVQITSSQYDVSTPFNLELSPVKSAPELANVLPDSAEIVVNADSELLFAFEDDSSNFFTMSLARSFNDLSYSSNNGSNTIDAKYIDSDSNIWLKVENNVFKFKDIELNEYVDIFSPEMRLEKVHVLTLSDSLSGNTSKTSWEFTINDWSKIEVLDGDLPSNAVDGSTIRVTHNGKYDGINLYVNDIINPYDNKTKFILHRNGKEVSNDVNTAGNLPVSGDAVKAFVPSASTLAGRGLEAVPEDNTLEVRLDGNSNNFLSMTNSGLMAELPTILNVNALRETASNFNYQSNIQLSLGIRNIFTINYPGGSVSPFFTNLTDYDFNNVNTAIAKTITIIIINAASISWPSEIIWADGTAPTIEPDQYLVVSGIHVKSGIEEITNGKILCTFSYYNR